jgi:hypothetical protein
MDRSPSPVPLIATGTGKPEMATSLIYSASHPLDPQIMRLSGDAASHHCATTLAVNMPDNLRICISKSQN